MLVISSSRACARIAVLVANGMVWRRVWGLKMSPEAIFAFANLSSEDGVQLHIGLLVHAMG